MRLFFYGTLLDDDIRRLVLGRALDAALRPALLRHFRRVYVAGRPYPMILPHRGGAVQGAIAERLGRDELDRIQNYEGDSYRLERQMVLPLDGASGESGAAVAAWLFRGAGATRASTRPWDLADWQAKEKAAFSRALRQAASAEAAAALAHGGPGSRAKS